MSWVPGGEGLVYKLCIVVESTVPQSWIWLSPSNSFGFWIRLIGSETRDGNSVYLFPFTPSTVLGTKHTGVLSPHSGQSEQAASPLGVGEWTGELYLPYSEIIRVRLRRPKTAHDKVSYCLNMDDNNVFLTKFRFCKCPRKMSLRRNYDQWDTSLWPNILGVTLSKTWRMTQSLSNFFRTNNGLTPMKIILIKWKNPRWFICVEQKFD